MQFMMIVLVYLPLSLLCVPVGLVLKAALLAPQHHGEKKKLAAADF